LYLVTNLKFKGDEMETITITRGLAELKLLDSRIDKETNKAIFIDCYSEKNKKGLISKLDIQEIEKNANSCYQSILDLIKRRNAIKNAINDSNSKTIVKIGSNEMTVLSAIEKKYSIKYEKELLARMKSNLATVKDTIEGNNLKNEKQIQEMLIANLGKDSKASKDDYDLIAKPFLDANQMKQVGLKQIEKEIEKLDLEIDNFITEVDFVLSESNSKTSIEVKV
jgi:hypothetical protein